MGDGIKAQKLGSWTKAMRTDQPQLGIGKAPKMGRSGVAGVPKLPGLKPQGGVKVKQILKPAKPQRKI